jgi:hypothetical protein
MASPRRTLAWTHQRLPCRTLAWPSRRPDAMSIALARTLLPSVLFMSTISVEFIISEFLLCKQQRQAAESNVACPGSSDQQRIKERRVKESFYISNTCI